MDETKKDTRAITNFEYGARFINPEALADELGFEPGMAVADFGCGTGYFSIPVAKKVGNSGIVYAIDIQKEKLESVESQARILGLTNIATKRENLERKNGSGLETASMDWVLLVNMLFQNKDKEIIIAEARRVLKNKGKMLVIEWKSEGVSFGPKEEVKISQRELLKTAQKNGLEMVREMEIGNFNYGIIFVK